MSKGKSKATGKTGRTGAQKTAPVRRARTSQTSVKSNVPKSAMDSRDPFTSGPGYPVQNQVDFANEQGRRGSEIMGLASGPIATTLINATVARRRSRHAVLTNAYAKHAVDVMVANVVGEGHRLISEAPNEAFQDQVEALWEAWCEEADATGSLDFAGLEALAFRSMCEGGDSFVRMRMRRPEDNMIVPLQLQLFESEQVPVTKNESNGKQPIIGGIQFDAIGEPIFYHMHLNHPGEFNILNMQQGIAETVPVPARDVCHLHDVKRPNEVRGLPVLSQALIQLSDLDRYMDAELVRKKAAALIGGFIRRPTDNPELNPMITTQMGVEMDGDEEFHIEALEPGSFPILPPGFEVSFSEPTDVGGNFKEFLRQQLLMIAASLNLTYEQLTGDYSGTNDRTVRAAMLEFKRIARQYQSHILLAQFCRPIFRRWFDMAVMSGALVIPDGMDIVQARRVRWVADPWDYLNPLQDIKSKVDEIRAGLLPRSEVIIQRGGRPDNIDKQFKRDQDREASLGLVFDTNVSVVSKSGTAQNSNQNSVIADDEEDDDQTDEEQEDAQTQT